MPGVTIRKRRSKPKGKSKKINVYRISQYSTIDEAFSGNGPAENGGRFNYQGMYVVYTSSSIPLAEKEVLNNTDDSKILDFYYKYAVSIPTDEIATLDEKTLPKDWDKGPGTSETANLGFEWYERKKKLILKVPSAQCPGEYNFILNCSHKDFKKLKPRKLGKHQTDYRTRSRRDREKAHKRLLRTR
jgi:RES domain-containing protein